MNRNDLDKRLRDLGLYSEFYHRKELKPLAQVLKEGEQLNCLFTGVHEANRKMVAITDRRIIILFTLLGGGDFKVIKRSAVSDYSVDKKLLFSTVNISTKGGETFTFTNAQGSVKKLFEWAMERPVPEEE